MTDEQFKYWENLMYRYREEGFLYCFKSYSNFEEIEDEEFHRMRENFLSVVEEFQEYMDSKYAEGAKERGLSEEYDY